MGHHGLGIDTKADILPLRTDLRAQFDTRGGLWLFQRLSSLWTHPAVCYACYEGGSGSGVSFCPFCLGGSFSGETVHYFGRMLDVIRARGDEGQGLVMVKNWIGCMVMAKRTTWVGGG